MVVLKSNSYSPFDTWSDWYDEENYEVMITFNTINDELISDWSIKENPVEVTPQKIGIDVSTNYDDEDRIDVVYDVTLISHTLSKEKCLEAVDIINRKYDEDIELKLNDEQVVSENYDFQLFEYINNSVRITTMDKLLFNTFFNQNINSNEYDKSKLYLNDITGDSVDIYSIYSEGVNYGEDTITVVFPKPYITKRKSEEYAEEINRVTEYTIQPESFLSCNIKQDIYSSNGIIDF